MQSTSTEFYFIYIFIYCFQIASSVCGIRLYVVLFVEYMYGMFSRKKTLYLEVLYCTVGIKLLVTDNRRSFDIILICTG